MTHQLEKEIEAATASAATVAEIQTRTAMEGMRRDVQAQIKQNCTDAQWRDEENQKTIQQIAASLENLTKQLNDFHPVNVEHVGMHKSRLLSSLNRY